MKSMEVHFGVIRDKQAIHAGLGQSKSQNHQLAICYNNDGVLTVKICSVVDIVHDQSGTRVILRQQPDQPQTEFTIPFDHIQSIYPIREFDSAG